MTAPSPDTDQREPGPVEAREFHRLARTSPGYRWWKPLLVALVGAAFYVAMLLLTLAVAALVGLFLPRLQAATTAFFTDPTIDLNDPCTLAGTLLSVILLLPALLLATRLVGARPVGMLSSVVLRIRWGWLLRCLGFAAAIYVAGYLVIFAAAAVQGQPVAPQFDTTQALVVLALVVLLVPLQAAAEEYLFRGYLMQSIGGWLRHPIFAIALPIPLFVIGHDYGLLGTIYVAAFAAVSGWLCWRTGGLEASIALHIVNNAAIFALGAFGLVDANSTDTGVLDLVISLAMMLVFAGIAVRAARRHNIERTGTAVPGAGAVAGLPDEPEQHDGHLLQHG
jgi:membrane protease YdiL (CAAX protease family)